MCVADAKHVDNWETFGSCSIEREQSCSAISIPRSALALPIRNRGWMSNKQAEEAPVGSEPAQDFPGSLRQIIGSHISQGALKIENAADVAGMSPRTLERYLAKDGLTYRKLVGQVRYREAERLLLDPHLPIRDIANGLGYSNLQHFHRAFRRWSGVTPGTYRRDRKSRRAPKKLDTMPCR